VPGPSAKLGTVLSQFRFGVGDCTNWYSAAPLGLVQVHPFLDARFASLCMGIHTRFQQEPGQQKPLLAQAMRDVLPEQILKRRRKSHYSSLIHAGMRRNRQVLERLIRQAPEDIFDKDVLLQCLNQAVVGAGSSEAMGRLHQSLAWLRWYTMQDKKQQPVSVCQPEEVGAGRFS
jgi:asparagine synthase (glutamine-hydrolysing)